MKDIILIKTVSIYNISKYLSLRIYLQCFQEPFGIVQTRYHYFEYFIFSKSSSLA